MPDIHSSHKLIIVTGKGGVGKTLLAAGLARLSAGWTRGTTAIRC